MRRQIVHNVKWLAITKVISQTYTWIVTFLVIRLLTPEDYGFMSMSEVFYSLMLMFSQFGLGAVLVQRKEIDASIIRQVLSLLMLLNIVLFVILVISSDAISNFYGEPIVAELLKTLSIVFLFLPYVIINSSLLARDMRFKEKGVAELLAAVVSATVTLTLAYQDYGVWALVYGAVSLHFTKMLMFQLLIKKIYLPVFQLDNINELMTFGIFTLGATLFWFAYTSSDSLIAGKYLGAAQLGIYAIALQISTIPLNKIFPIINQIALSGYAKVQSDMDIVRRYYLRSIELVVIILAPVFLGIASISNDLILVVIGEKWKDVALPLEILCFVMVFRSIDGLYGPMLTGLGKPKYTMYNQMRYALVLPALYILGVNWGVIGIAAVWIAGFSVLFVVNTIITNKIIGMANLKYLKNIYKPIVIAVIMYLCVKTTGYMLSDMSKIVRLPLLIVLGGMLYVLLLYIGSKQSIYRILEVIKNR